MYAYIKHTPLAVARLGGIEFGPELNFNVSITLFVTSHKPSLFSFIRELDEIDNQSVQS